MKKKGLCTNCLNDKSCSFSRKFPVLQCEEFRDYQPKSRKAERPKAEHKQHQQST